MTRRILVACECSGVVRQAFAARGWDAWSCDLKPTEQPGQHIQGDALEAIRNRGPWDVLIAHPECRFMCSSGLHWNWMEGRAEKTEEALQFTMDLFKCGVPRIALENPVGCIGTRICASTQSIQPYEFGDDASKKTHLWLIGLPPIIVDPRKRFPGRKVVWPPGSGKIVERWSNQTDSGQNREGPSKERSAIRAKTYPGIANAMADQWSDERIYVVGPGLF